MTCFWSAWWPLLFLSVCIMIRTRILMAAEILEIQDIWNFFGEEFKRPYLYGNKLIKSKHIFNLKVKRKQNELHFFALCLRGSNIGEKPWDMNVKLAKKTSGGVVRIEAFCRCKAGAAGKCKHVCGCLMMIERMSASDLEEATCTELPQKWGQTGNNLQYLYDPVPITEFYHFPKRKKREYWKNLEVTDEVLAAAKEIILSGSPNAMVKRSEQGRGTLVDIEPPNVYSVVANREPIPDALYQKLKTDLVGDPVEPLDLLTNDELIRFYFSFVYVLPTDIRRIYENSLGQDNVHWRKERQVRITGYTAHAFNVKKPKISWDDRCEKTFFGSFKNEATQYGTNNEKNALRCYAQKFPSDDVMSAVGFCVNASAPMLGYSPDGIVNGDTLLEVKCPVKGQECYGTALLEKCDFLKNKDGTFQLKRGHQYYTQIQMGMSILNLRKTHFMVYYHTKKRKRSDDEPKEGVIVFEVEREDDFCSLLLSTLKARYFQYVLPFLVANEKRLLVSKC